MRKGSADETCKMPRKKQKEAIRNRIIGHGQESVQGILFNPKNWRIHPELQQKALVGVLNDVGWVQDVIMNKRTGHLVDGHLRVTLADRQGEEFVPVTYVDLSQEEEDEILLTLDPLGAMAAADKQKLAGLLKDAQSENEEVQKLIAQIAAREGILQQLDPNQEWQGMPEYHQENTFGAVRSIIVHFASEADLEQFAQLLGQVVTAKSRYIWYPPRKRDDLKSLGYKVEP